TEHVALGGGGKKYLGKTTELVGVDIGRDVDLLDVALFHGLDHEEHGSHVLRIDHPAHVVPDQEGGGHRGGEPALQGPEFVDDFGEAQEDRLRGAVVHGVNAHGAAGAENGMGQLGPETLGVAKLVHDASSAAVESSAESFSPGWARCFTACAALV